MAKRKRQICDRCYKPKPQACICSALPELSKLIHLSSSRVLVLQHPHEAKRKNRSLPLIQLCMFSSSNPGETDQGSWHRECMDNDSAVDGHYTIERRCGEHSSENNETDGTRSIVTSKTDDIRSSNSFDFNFETIITKRLGDQIAQSHPRIMELLHDPNNPVLLCYPSDDAISLQEAMERVKNLSKEGKRNPHEHNDANDKDLTQTEETMPMNVVRKKCTIIFIDATWKYAKEMDMKSIENKSWPKHMIRFKLNPKKGDCGERFKPRRFDIRSPPSINHLSTAECIAHVLRIVEADEGSEVGLDQKDDSLFDTLMKPLDLMVKQWHSFSEGKRMK